MAVTFEFIGPLGVAVVGSRRALDLLWVVLAAAGIVLLADYGGGSLDPAGVAFALAAGALWAAYIVLSQRTGTLFGGGSGLAVAMVAGAALVGAVRDRRGRHGAAAARSCSAPSSRSRSPPRCCPTRSTSRRCGGCPSACSAC